MAARGRRFWILILAGVLLAILALGLLGVDRSNMLDLSPSRQSVPVLVGVEDHARFTLTNNHPWNDARIDYIKAQCGCFRVGETPKVVPSGESREITLSIFIDPMGDRTHNTLIVKLMNGTRIEGEITAEPVPPFEGWPGYAQGAPDAQSGTTRVVLDEAYRGRVISAQGYSAEGVALETLLDAETGEIVLLDAGEGATLSLMFQTDEGERPWTGEVMDAAGTRRSP